MGARSWRQDKRRRTRAKVNWPLVVELGDRALHGETIDVSQLGVKARLGEQLEVGSHVTLHLNPPRGCPVEARAVVWRMDDDGPVFVFLEKKADVVPPGNGKQPPAPQLLTILVVDDDPGVGSVTRDILGSAGYLVLFTDDPIEAIRLARERPGEIDLLLVDVVMPLMDGRELVRRVLDLRPSVKVLLMSGFGMPSLRDLQWPVIAKPFDVPALIAKIEECITGRRRPSPFTPPRPSARRPTERTTRSDAP